MPWPWAICGILILVIIALLIKTASLRRAVDEIRAGLAAKLEHDTNTLISISSGDRHIRRLAAGINTQLRLLRKERHRFQTGDLALKEAVTNMSHDLRTPLTAILGYLDLLKREVISEDAARYLDMIENRALALTRLTGELLRYSVVISAEKDAAYEDIALNSALEESISAYYAALKGSGITPEVSMPEQNVLRRLDPNALSRIFGNIIGNAIKYSDGGLSVVLRENGEIIFSNPANDLTPVTAGKLFDRFFTVETGRGGGSGLGLSIAKLLTEQMGGTITSGYSEGKLFIKLCFAP